MPDPAPRPLIGRTAKIEYKFVTGSVYTKVAIPFMIDPPKPECGDIEWTNLDSPGRSREYVPGLINYGECSFECLQTDANLALLSELAHDQNADGTVDYEWKVTGPDPVGALNPKVYTFKGYLKTFDPGSYTSDEDIVKCKGVIKVSGPVTLA